MNYWYLVLRLAYCTLACPVPNTSFHKINVIVYIISELLTEDIAVVAASVAFSSFSGQVVLLFL